VATARPFAYNPSQTPISGTEQVGDLAIGYPSVGFTNSGLQWWNGPDEELGYVICKPIPLDNQPTPVPGDNIFLSTTYKATDISLSNNNQTAAQIFSYQQSVLGETLISGSNKVMFSVKFTSTNPPVGVGGRFIGVGNTSMNYNGNPFGGYPGNDTNSIGFSDDGKLYYNGATVSVGLPTWSSGDIIDISISHGQYWWVRVNGSDWNNSNTADPSTLSGGLTMSGLTNYYTVLCPYIYGTMEILNIPKYGYPSGYNFLGKTTASVGFLRSTSLTDQSFVDLVNSYFNQNYITPQLCKDWLTTNGYWTSWGSLPSGMVLYLDAGISNSYSGSGTTWYDLSGNNNDGEFSGGATYASDSGGTMVFDGVDSAITFNNPVNIPIGNEPYTISVWFNSDEMPSNRGFVGWGGFGNSNEVNAWRLRDTGVSGFRHYWWGNDLDYTTPMTTSTWYHAIAAYENGSRKLYLNNVQVAEDFPTGHNVTDSSNLRIGVTADFLGEWFLGKIAQVVIYKRQATVAEINAIWNSGKSRFGY
jgi:hypothetical protein